MGIQKNFKISNGLEVNDNLIFADGNANKVGIATTNPQYLLHVNGGIGATNSVFSGISTVNDLRINGRVTAGSSLGAAGQYLVSTGTGVTWGSVPTVRSTDIQTAGVGATTFNTTYTVGLLDVYINGVKLSSDEYLANNGATVSLNGACFGGETVEFISYSPFGIGIGGTSIQGITILEEGFQVGSALQVTSINFVGAAVTAVGTGVGVTVYVNDSINPNYWGSTVAGIHTLSRVGIGTTNPRFALEVGAVGTSGTTLYVNGNARITGIVTIGTSSITLDGTDNQINVGSGVTIHHTNGVQVGENTVHSSGITLNNINISGVSTLASLTVPGSAILNSSKAEFHFTGDKKFETTNTGITIVGQQKITDGNLGANINGLQLSPTVFDQANIYHPESGLLSIENFISSGAGGEIKIGVNAPSITSVSEIVRIKHNAVGIGSTLPTSALTVTGNTSLETLNVSGVSTFVGNVGVGTTNATSKLTVCNGDISVGVSTAHGVILTSPNGTQYRLIVDDSGTLSTVAV